MLYEKLAPKTRDNHPPLLLAPAMRAYRDILKHSAIYGLGQVLARLASVLMLPLYTRYLRPADYAVIAILDVTAGILGILIGSGMVAAVTRHHFEETSDDGRRRVWWTGLTFLFSSALAVSIPTILLRGPLAWLIVGPDAADGGLALALVVATIGINVLGQLADAYLRVRKWSGTSVAWSLARLLLNIALNVLFLVKWNLGVLGVLYGNLMTSVVMTAILCAYLAWNERPFAVDRNVMRQLLAFGAPLIGTTILSLVMHDADRYLLRMFVSMEEVGVYSLAYQIGQGVNSLCLIPFSAIWSVVVYEIAAHPNSRQAYARVFGIFFEGLALVLFAASLFAHALLELLTTADYEAAADIIPVVCLAYLFFSLHEHFRVPVMLAKKTLSLLPACIVAATVNIAANCVLIPWLGAVGAAWASVLTFLSFSGTGLLLYRRFDRYPYPFLRCLLVLAGMAASWVGWRACAGLPESRHLALAAVIWTAWAALLVAPHARRWLKHRQFFPETDAIAPTASARQIPEDMTRPPTDSPVSIGDTVTPNDATDRDTNVPPTLDARHQPLADPAPATSAGS